VKVIGNGRGTRFGLDKWCSVLGHPVEDSFLGFFFLSKDPTGSVLSHWTNADWNIKVPYLNQEEYTG